MIDSSNLPLSWSVAPIADLCIDIKQRAPATEEHFTYIDIASVDRDLKKITQPQTLIGKDAPSRARKVIAVNDVLVSMTRPNLNAVALVQDDFTNPIASTGFDVLRAYLIESKWLFFHVRSQSFIDAMSDKVQGALYPAVKSSDIRSYEIPVPPLAEQQEIAARLDELLAQVDTIKARLDAIPAILKRFRQSVLAAAVSGKLTEDWRAGKNISALQLATELLNKHSSKKQSNNAALPTYEAHTLSKADIPDEWEILTLEKCCEVSRPITYGILKPGEDYEGGVTYIKVRDYPNNELVQTGFMRTSPEIANNYRRSFLDEGDLLLSIRGTVGRIVKIPKRLHGANITQDSARISIKNRTMSDYILWYMKSPNVQNRMEIAKKGVAVKGINIGDVRALQIALPCLEEQTEIVRRVEQLFAFADQIEQQVQAAQTRVNNLTQAILAKAFKGELTADWRAAHPELISGENSAQALLNKIKATSTASKPKRSKAQQAELF